MLILVWCMRGSDRFFRHFEKVENVVHVVSVGQAWWVSELSVAMAKNFLVCVTFL